MIKVIDLADDTNVGGALRGLTTIMHCFDASIATVLMSIHTAWHLAPRLQGGIVILNLTVSRAKLVFFPGKLAEPKQFLSEVEILAPSGWEAIGLVGNEAWAAGYPIIASAIDRLIEQMNESCGPLVPHSDQIVLDTGILHLATLDRVKMGRAARVSMPGRFADKTAAWQNLLRALIPNANLGSVAVTP